jgi:hypothetical protein
MDESNQYDHLSGGTIFNMTFKMSPLKFLWAVIVVIVISLIIVTVGGLIMYGLKYFELPRAVIGLVSIVIGLFFIYAPYDYIYTMGYTSRR